jgi:hypothetical protein
MFDYWMKKCLVQVRQLDDSFAQEMQVASSAEEWRLRGIKVSTIYYVIGFDPLLLKHILSVIRGEGIKSYNSLKVSNIFVVVVS